MHWLTELSHNLYRTFIEKDRYIAFLKGIGTTLEISFFAVLLGTAIGVIVAVVKHMAKKYRFLRPLEWLSDAYVLVIRGTPVYVQLLVLNTVVLASVQNKILVAVITFGVNSGAYVAEIIRAGINSVDKGSLKRAIRWDWGTEPSCSLSSSRRRCVIFCRLWAMSLSRWSKRPPLPHDGGQRSDQSGRTGRRCHIRFIYALLSIAVIYFVLVFGMTRLLNRFERRLAKSDNR